MSQGFSRRDFMKAAGATTAGVLIATGFSPLSYAENEKVTVASIGTGGQGSFHLRDGLGRAADIKILAVCDVYKPHLEGGWNNAGGRDVKKYMDYREMLDKEKDLDAVVISTPLATHHAITMDCLDAGKYCFTEKTLCYTIEECRDLVKKAHEKGLFVQVGHQRRYNPIYNKAIKLAWEEGVLGRINHIECQWHRNNDWRRPVDPNYVLSPEEKKWIPDLERHLNWRLYRDLSYGLMTELATHQLDIATWFLDAMPKRVYGYGGIDYWRDGREVYDNVSLVYEYEITEKSRGYRKVPQRNKYQKMDEVNAPYDVRVMYSSICANAKKGCSESILGDDGGFEMTEAGSLFYPEATSKVAWVEKGRRDASEENAIIITSGGTLTLSNKARKDAKPVLVNTDKSVDQLQFEAFTNDIKTKGTPKANILVGLKSAVCGLAGVQAMHEQRVIEIDPAWWAFDFETPDSGMYSV
jgi:predicted dehydrogenase